MKITDLTDDLVLQLEAAWAAAVPSMVDGCRSTDHLAWLLLQSDSQWYQIEGHRAWLYITDVQPGMGATVHALNLDGWDAVGSPKVAETLAEIMDEHRLVRLTAIVPAPVGKLHRALKMIGFEKEGRMRKSVVFNGRPTDAVIYGHLRKEVELEKAPRRRRRKRKGASWEAKIQPELAASSDKSEEASKASPDKPNSKDKSYSKGPETLRALIPSREDSKTALIN